MLNHISTKTSLNVLLLLVLVLGFIAFKELLASVALAVMFVILIYPAYFWLLNKTRLNNNIVAFLLTLLILCFFIFPLFFFTTLLFKEANVIYQKANQFLMQKSFWGDSIFWQDLQRWAEEYDIDINVFIGEYLVPGIKSFIATLSATFGAFIVNTLQLAILFLVTIVCVFFFLRDGSKIVDFLKKISPLTDQQTEHLFAAFTNVISAVLLANLLVAFVQGILGGFGFWIFGIPAPVFWGTVIFFLSLVPFLGPAFVYGPTALFLFFLSRDAIITLLYLGYNVFIVSSVDNIIRPLIIGGKTKLHPLLSFLSIVGGLRAWGIMGIFYGPLVAALLLLVFDLHLKETEQRSLFEK